MLEVLEQAQAGGQKIQQDALIGQGSIFDLHDELTARRRRRGRGVRRRGALAGAGLARPIHPPIPREEFDQPELLAAEKEAIGLFVSAHPLKPLREALRARVDCPISALADRRDKDWVTVGGIITEAKRIRTRNGDPMMFATLDDLGGRSRCWCSARRWPSTRRRWRSTRWCSSRAASITRKPARRAWWCRASSRSRPPRRRSSEPARRRARPARTADRARPARAPARQRRRTCRASVIDDLKQAIEDFPGPAEVLVEIDTTATGTRRVRLGEAYRVQNTPTRAGRARARAGARQRSRLPRSWR